MGGGGGRKVKRLKRLVVKGWEKEREFIIPARRLRFSGFYESTEERKRAGRKEKERIV